MTAPLSSPSVVLPIASISLLGAGAEGANLLSEFGLSSDGFDAEFAAMLQRLETSDSADASVQAEVAKRLTAAARRATGVLSVTSLDEAIVPTYAFPCGEQALVLRVHGPVAEWLLVPEDEGGRLVLDAVERAPSGAMVLASRGGDPFAAAMVHDGQLRTAARSVGSLEALPAAGSLTLEVAIRWLFEAASDGASRQ
ncbi:hypothetical protein [Nocardioides sp.]|uniref:hypothetical protein n=1 Tax=Nocardioides sp. TaxID=35761 RepID=UPI0027339D52|nr:hypothetical protein [Nocardioides sp.]MDP3889649.1 hypothetical protein [Nocardioides sp.]